jgi:methylthioxylose transferase
VCAGPAAAVVVRRALAGIRLAGAVRLLPLAALAAMLAADASGLSKAEVERIWLPFAVWLVAGAALIPERHRRRWLAIGAATALLVNHLLLTTW